MKAVILAGGMGTRISEETHLKPKPMIEIGGMPILWHIMKIYSFHNINEFIICCGYKGYLIKEYFANYLLHMSDVTIDISNNSVDIHKVNAEPWKITLIDTGEKTMTGGRLKRVSKYLNDNEDFCMTYGDGLGNIDINSLIKAHKNLGRIATVSATVSPARFGALEIKSDQVIGFREKPKGDGMLINGGFFVLSSSVLDLIKDDTTVWEKEPMNHLAINNMLSVYEHKGFWHPMDTLRDKTYLENLWTNGNAPWKLWE